MKIIRLCFVLVGWVLFATKLSVAAPPFQNTYPEPTTSPYLNMVNQRNRTTPYQTLVRPILERQQQAAYQQSQLDRLERQQQALRPRLGPPRLGPPPTNLGASRNIRSTGHETRFSDGRRFQDHLHFFPQRVPR